MIDKISSDYTFIEVKGTNYQIGNAIGEHLLNPIHQLVNRLKDFLKIPETSASEHIQEMRRLIERYFPRYSEELRGVADGADVSIEDMVLALDEETIENIMNLVTPKCTTIAYSREGVILLAHNEDWKEVYQDMFYIIQAYPDEGCPFLSLAYTGSLPGSAVALNAYGIAFSGNTILEHEVNHHGLPKNVILRSQIEASTLKEFESRAIFRPRALPNHSMAIDGKGNIVSVEVSIGIHDIQYCEGWSVHTNHALRGEIEALERGDRQDSIARYETAKAYVEGAYLEGNGSRELLETILSNHEKEPHSICSHLSPKLEKTIASVIVDVKGMSMSVAKGNPCDSPYSTYPFQ